MIMVSELRFGKTSWKVSDQVVERQQDYRLTLSNEKSHICRVHLQITCSAIVEESSTHKLAVRKTAIENLLF